MKPKTREREREGENCVVIEIRMNERNDSMWVKLNAF